jgi:hypothetical protein
MYFLTAQRFMALFTNTSFRPSDTFLSSRILPKPPTRIPGLGYLVFPASETQNDPSATPFNASPVPKASTPESGIGQDRDPAGAEEAQNTAESAFDQQALRRRALEAAEARKGEEDWVRSGGVLRDEDGQRDWPRTQAIREELRLRELEAQIIERWENYEKRWSEILSRLRKGCPPTLDAFLRFHDIPWPMKPMETVGGGEVKAEDLTVEHVKDFLLEDLSVRGVKTTKKDRIRSSLLRWHPDKLGSLLQQIHPEDRENVHKGLGIVMECLQKLNAES